MLNILLNSRLLLLKVLNTKRLVNRTFAMNVQFGCFKGSVSPQWENSGWTWGEQTFVSPLPHFKFELYYRHLKGLMHNVYRGNTLEVDVDMKVMV